MNIVFFGSTSDSVIVLEKISQLSTVHWSICCIVTQPPRPIGRKQIITPTPVETWGVAHNIPVVSFPSNPKKPWLYENEQVPIDTLEPFKADLLVSASYGLKIPTKTITDAPLGGLNIHPSILPRWRGADPVPWAIMSGDHQLGVTIVTLSEQFDEGRIIAQKKIPIKPTDTSDPLRTELFSLGADELITLLKGFKGQAFKGAEQDPKLATNARKFTRDDGFEHWDALQKATSDTDEAIRIDRKFRALTPWPGLWTEITIQREQQNNENDNTTKTMVREKKRLKIISCHLSPVTCLVIDTVQLEGKQPVSYAQFTQAYL